MSRPEQVERFMRMESIALGTFEDQMREYIYSLESKLPPEPEEVKWEKYERGVSGVFSLQISTNSGCWRVPLPERFIDEILRNREIVRRGIDWEKFKESWKKIALVDLRDETLAVIRRSIEQQTKGGRHDV